MTAKGVEMLFGSSHPGVSTNHGGLGSAVDAVQSQYLQASGRHVLTVDDFFAGAELLREAYLDQFTNQGKEISGSKFCWQFYHVPGQYTYLRTQTRNVFPAEVHDRFLKQLGDWVVEHLGCEPPRNPWLSFYVNDFGQEVHADNSHGPWAFVYSLTDWNQRRFDGGETILATDRLTDYWKHSIRSALVEATAFQRIEPRFNRLTIFNAMVPHGVRRLRGTTDPRSARVVVHGWLAARQIKVLGARVGKGDEPLIRQQLAPLRLLRLEEFAGHLIMRIDISPAGEVASVRVLTNTMVHQTGASGAADALTQRAVGIAATLRLPSASGPSQVLLPLRCVFSQGGPAQT